MANSVITSTIRSQLNPRDLHMLFILYMSVATLWISTSTSSVVGLQTKYRSTGRVKPVVGFRRLSPRYSAELANGGEMMNSKTASTQEGKQSSGNYSSIGLSSEQKVINLLFLSAAFSYAIFTIFNIDSGMTRGWSTSEIAMRIPLDNWGRYESYLANKPIITKTLINVIIYLLGDWLSQTAFQGKNVLDFDISRTLRNGFIGLCFGPLVHQYYEFSDKILPPDNGLFTKLEKILMDQTIYLSVKCSAYISAVGLLGGEDWVTVTQTVKDKIWKIVVTGWKFWPVVHTITYSFIPAQHRILWVNSVDLVWNAILASQAQRKESVFEQDEGAEEQKLLLCTFDEAKSITFSDAELVISIDNIALSDSTPVPEVNFVAPTNSSSQPNASTGF